MTHSQKPADPQLPPEPHRPGLSRRQAKFVRKGLGRLGHRTYAGYLGSPHWQGLRVRYASSRRPKRCAVCHDPGYELHHRTYRRLGAERLDDLLPLCGRHHDAIHAAALSLWDGHRALRNLRRAGGGRRVTHTSTRSEPRLRIARRADRGRIHPQSGESPGGAHEPTRSDTYDG